LQKNFFISETDRIHLLKLAALSATVANVLDKGKSMQTVRGKYKVMEY